MYGWIQESIEALVLAKFGAATWAEIKARADLSEVPDYGFARHEYYTDDVTLRLVDAASKVLGLDAGTVLTVYGEYFITWLVSNGYGTMLKNQGTNLFDFLNSMDAMHSGLQVCLPELVPPQLSCRKEGGGLVLDYASQRGGLAPMMIGLIRGVGKEIFSSEYACTLVEEWETATPKGIRLRCSRFMIQCERGQPLDGARSFGATTSRSRVALSSKEARSYQFFQHNAVMAGAWVDILAKRVQTLTTLADAQSYGCNFDIHELCSLMAVTTGWAEAALTALFRTPLRCGAAAVLVPQYGFISGPGGVGSMRTKMLPTPVMHPGVISGEDPLVRTVPSQGLRQVRVELSVCMVPCPAMGGWLLRALADTPNTALLSTLAARAILQSSWQQVRRRVLLDTFLNLAVVVLATCWCADPSHGYIAWQFLVVMFCKEAFEAIMEVRAHLRNKWRRELCSVRLFARLCMLGLYLYLLNAIIAAGPSANAIHSRLPLAVFSCARWWALLWSLRIFSAFGPKVLPILYTLASMGPFVLVILMLMLGLLCAYAALEGSGLNGGLLKSSFFLGFLGQLDAFPGAVDAEQAVWLEFWLHLFAVIITIVMVNILIGVLSESYDVYQNSADVIFERERALMILTLSLRLLPVAEFRRPWQWLQAFVCIEAPEDWITGNRHCFLWACAPLDEPASLSRLNVLNRHVDRRHQATVDKLDGIARRLEPLEGVAAHAQKLDELRRGLDELSGTCATAAGAAGAAGAAASACPCRGRMPVEAEGPRVPASCPGGGMLRGL